MSWAALWNMNPPGRVWDPASNISDTNCTDGVQWIYKILNDCVYDAQGISSEVLGLASLLTWMIVSIPQMVKNFRHIEGIEGISVLLILNWTLGDSTNLAGAILTKQLPLQIYLAIYFVFADIILFGQYLYFNLWWKRKRRGYQPIASNDVNGPSKAVLCIAGALMFTLQGYLKLSSSYRPEQTAHSIRHPAGRNLLSHNLQYHFHVFHNLEDEIGYGIGIVSSIFYIGSRTGQMYKNYKRQSTDGLSIMMFILAVLGNIFYGASIIVRQLDANYILRHLPWLVGSLGVVFLDLSLLLQFKFYSNKKDFNTLLNEPLNADVDIHVHIDPQSATIN